MSARTQRLYLVPLAAGRSARVGPSAREEALVLATALLTLLALALRAARYSGVFEGDALSRTFAAASVFYAGHPSITNIGFVWPPLSIALQVPFILVGRLLGLGVTPAILSANVSALSLLVFNRVLYPLIPDRPFRLLVLALYATNPLILIYAINGMSESLLVFCILVSVWCVQRLIQATSVGVNGAMLPFLALMGVSAGVGFLTRYEGASLGVALVPSLYLALVGRKYSRRGYEAYSLVYLLPFAYAVLSWLLANWLIMGNPLHFIAGTTGSDRDLSTATLLSYLQPTRHNIVQSALYVVTVLFRLYPAYYLVLVASATLAFLRRSRLAAVVALMLVSFPVLQILLMYSGASYGWYRFQIYTIPLTVIGMAVLLGSIPASWRAQARVVGVVVLLAASAFTYVVVARPSFVYVHGWYGLNYEPYYVQAILGGQVVNDYGTMREIGTYLRTNLPNARILADERQADAIMVFDGNIDRYEMSRSPQYKAVVDSPVGQVDYILVCDTVSGAQNFIVKQYPNIFEQGAPFLHLEREWTESNKDLPAHWRLYKVVAPTGASAPAVGSALDGGQGSSVAMLGIPATRPPATP